MPVFLPVAEMVGVHVKANVVAEVRHQRVIPKPQHRRDNLVVAEGKLPLLAYDGCTLLLHWLLVTLWERR